MEAAAVGAARWALGKALAPVADGVLQAWAASQDLGPNVDALKMELLYAQGMLENSQGREIRSSALKQLLDKLRQLAYSADDVLDELEYFRIQDELDGTYDAAGEQDGGCLRDHARNARHTAKALAKKLGLSRSDSRGSRDEPDEDERGVVSCGAWPCRGPRTADDEQEDTSRGVLCGAAWLPCGKATSEPHMLSSPPTNQGGQQTDGGCLGRLASGARNTIGKHFPCYSASSEQNHGHSNMASSEPQRDRVVTAPKLKFNRVEMSKRMKEIVEQLKPVCAKVSTILNLELLNSNRSILTNKVAMSRPTTTPEFIETEFCGREDETIKIIDQITKGKWCDKDLTVLPIVGPGGIGKTTLTQQIYKELTKKDFELKIWVCVSVSFHVHRLTEEIADALKIDKNDRLEKLVEMLKSKKFLLVLDDMWKCDDDEWTKFLVPFKKGQTKGNVILVTTRFPALAQMVKTTDHPIDLEGLDPAAFEKLFLAFAFGGNQSRNDPPGLLETGHEIMGKLKRSPLAAKTVGKLLRNHLDLDHWTRVLESKEWESQTGENDIMPALKLSYDYLPFHLQQCFAYCALFPEDYKFKREELIHLWIGLDILHSHDENKRVEDIGQDYLEELVNHGFFKKEEQEDGHTCYIIHDLLHELALKVSSRECVSIYSSNMRTIQIPLSIRHLSINIDDTSVKDREAFDLCKKDLSTIVEGIKAENLHSLMLFGGHQGSFVKTFGRLFKKAKSLRVIFLSKAPYNMDDLLHKKLVHLRYLRIQSHYIIRLPRTVVRFYHLRVLDIQGCLDVHVEARDMGKLVKLRHFLVCNSKMHSSISEVGRLKLLQQLGTFSVKKETEGFELRQIGHLAELRGSLCIENLERVEAKDMADEAEIMHKNHLHKLILDWDINRSNKDEELEEQVIESLKPSSNLRALCIRGHGGSTCPSWLGANLVVKNLKSLHLDGVAWKIFPPIGELWLVNEHGGEPATNIPDKKFQNLRRLELVNLPSLQKWVGDAPCQLFPLLEELIIKDCSELVELSFSHSTCCQQDKDTWFPRLQWLEIVDCSKLVVTLPPIPWTQDPCYVDIRGVCSPYKSLYYGERYKSKSGYYMKIEANDTLDSMFWNVLSFHNLIELKVFEMDKCPPLQLDHFQRLSSLKTLRVTHSSSAFLLVEDGSQDKYQFPVEGMSIFDCGASGKELTQILTHFPKLLALDMEDCGKITGLVVSQQQQTTPPAASSSAENGDGAEIKQHQQHDARGEEEIEASAADGLLLLPPQVQRLWIEDCKELILRPNPQVDNNKAGPIGEGGGLQRLNSLRFLWINRCPKFLSSYTSSSSCFPFPSSLEKLHLRGVEGMETLMPLSNLSSLTYLAIGGCGNLRGEGLWPLLAQGHLTELTVFDTPNFFLGSEPPRLQEEEPRSRSFKLQRLQTDDVEGVLAAPIRSFLCFSLTELEFWYRGEERFTKEQDEALPLLTSLQLLVFRSWDKLQCLPAGLRELPNLKGLEIWGCPSICSLPKDCLPSSLEKLLIDRCQSIRSLPKVDDLPSSLRELDVSWGASEELRRQCRKFQGTIPIVTVRD